MSLITLRPNGTTSNTGTVTGGGGVAHTALSDDSDATFVTFTVGQAAALALTDLTFPAGALMKSVVVRARFASSVNGTSVSIQGDLQTPPAGAGATRLTNSSSTTTIVVNSSGQVSGWDDPSLDAATLTVTNSFSLGASLVVYEAYVDVRIVIVPVFTTPAVSPPSTITTTNLPLLYGSALTYDAADGGSLTDNEWKVFTAAQYGIGGFDPATSPNTLASGIRHQASVNYQVVTPLADATYRAYSRIAQTVNGVVLWSAWNFVQFVVSVAIPAVPTMTLTAQATQGRAKIDVAGAGGGAATTTALELQRSVDGGTTWVAVRNNTRDDGIFIGTTVTIYDYEGPNGSAAQYRARALHDYSGIFAASAWSSTGSVTWTSTDWWIKDPTKPSLNLKLPGGGAAEMFSYADVGRASRDGAFQPVGATTPIVVRDTRAARTGTVTVQLWTAVERNTLDGLLDDLATLVLQGPAAHGEPDRYVNIGGTVATRVLDKGFSQVRRVTLPWTEVARPAGAIIGAEYV